MNEVCNCIPEPSNAYSHNAIVVKMKNTNGGEQDATTVGHVPDSLASSIGDGVTGAPLLKPILRSHFFGINTGPNSRLRSKRRGPCSQPWVVLRNEVE